MPRPIAVIGPTGTGKSHLALQIAEHFGCKTVDLTDTSMILQAVGDPAKIDALVEMIEKFKIIELVRTGKVLLARGAQTT